MQEVEGGFVSLYSPGFYCTSDSSVASQTDPQPGPPSGSGLHLQPRPDQLGAFADPQQAEVPARREIGGALRHLEAPPIITDLHANLTVSKCDLQVGAPGVCMPDHVAEGLLRDPVERQ